MTNRTQRTTGRGLALIVAGAALLAASCSPAALLERPPQAAASPTPRLDSISPTAPAPPETPSVRPTPTPYATPTPIPVPTRVYPTREERIVVTPDAERPPEGEMVTETDHFAFYSRDGTIPVAVPDLPEQAEIVFADVSARLGIPSQVKIRLTFRPPSSTSCPPRGLAAPRPPRIFIYADDGTGRDQILGVLAHELGHILIMERFQGVPRALNEGLATWASAPYFNAWLGNASLDAAVRSYLQDGSYLPLHQNYYLTAISPGTEEGSSESCIARRETLYTEWASFLGHLIEAHGWEKLEDLIRTVPGPERVDEGMAVKPADFEAVYGSALNQLEAAWLRRIRMPRHSAAAPLRPALPRGQVREPPFEVDEAS